MAFKAYVVANGDAKVNATSSAPVGTETIAATIPVGSVAVIVEDTAAINSNVITATIDRLRDLLMEANK